MSRYFHEPDTLCTSTISISISSVSTTGENRMVLGFRNRSSRIIHPSSILIRVAMRVSRSRWFGFIRRVFHYQNGSRSELGSNPFNTGSWMMMELAALVFQIVVTVYTLCVTKEERPIWPMRIWLSGYTIGCFLCLLQLHLRYRLFYSGRVDGVGQSSDVEQLRNHEDSRTLHFFNKCHTMTELFFAIWFVMGNVWVFNTRFGSFHRAPTLHVLCIILLAWNAISYSFPFILFLLLCCCVPLFSNLVGYNMNIGSVDRAASDEQLSCLPSFAYKEFDKNTNLGNSTSNNENLECCICLAKYKDKEEIRELPCSHIFHLKCVDQWLKIIACCPLCKQDLQR
ncbi:hypothetical protein Leryth_013776 [Lithospermum erythrorhizon]|nr:hypothetical protein Leryth_013776 [Lithospermum erythrorhizon]